MSTGEESLHPELARAKAHWSEALRGVDLPTPCPILRPPLEAEPPQLRREHRRSRAVGRSLARFARRHRFTFSTLIHGAWAIVLSRYGESHEVVFATARCSRLEGRRSLSFHPQRVRVDREASLLAWLREARAREDAAPLHGFSSLAELHAFGQALAGAPAFSSLVLCEVADAELPYAGLGHSEPAAAARRCPLTLHAERSNGELCLSIGYDATCIEPGAVERLLGHLEVALRTLVAADDQKVGRVQLLTPAEREQLLVTWNATSAPLPDACVHQLVEARAAQTPDSVALVFRGDELSYGRLNGLSNRLAHHLIDLGITTDALVGICAERSPELIVALLGILKAGGAYVALDPAAPSERLAFMIADAGISVVLTGAKYKAKLPVAGVRVVDLDGDWSSAGAGDSANPYTEVKPNHLAYVSFTSGSTGTPKGVSVPHQAVVRLVTGQTYCQMTPDRVFLQLAPISFDASTFEIWGALANGARLVVMPPENPGLEQLGAALRHHAVTTLWLTAGLFHLIVDENLEGLQSVRELLTGGDVVSPTHVRKLAARLPNCRVINGYGPTENTTFTCCYPVAAPDRLDTSVPIGRPIANTQIYLLGSDLEPVPVGIPGELYAGGLGLARGYLNRPELTRERFVPNPFSKDSTARLYKTGDYARYRPDGTVEFLGRRDNQVKIRGFRVELGEIEATLTTHEAVREAIVVARSDGLGRKQLVAYVVPAPHATVSSEVLRQFLDKSLPAYMVPTAWVLLDELPLGSNGKVDRKALPPPDLTRDADHDQPRTATEGRLAVLWAQVLRLERVGVNQNFFELGGDSLVATQLSHRVAQTLGARVSLSLTFEAPTIAEMARRIDAMSRSEPALDAPRLSSDSARRYDPFPLTDIQQAYFLGRSVNFELGNVSCHLYLEFISEALDLERLEAAWNQVVRRHDMLRAVVDSNGVQRVLERVPRYAFERYDARHPTDAQCQAALRELRARQSHEVFPPDRWPLFKITSILLPSESRLHLSFDLLIVDGFSFLVLFEEWRRYYEDSSWAPEPLEFNYRDYALAELGNERSPAYARAREYWRARLATLPPGPDLPLAIAPARIDKPVFVRVHHRLPAETWHELKRRAHARSLTPSALLCTAYADVLAAWASSSRFTLNLTLFNRLPIHPDVERLVGDFTTLTLLEVEDAAGASFEQRAKRLQAQLWRDLEHREYGGIRVLRDLARKHRWGTSARMPVVFTSLLRDFSKWNWLGRLDYSITQTPQVWLDHVAMESAGELVFHWDAVDRLFPDGLVQDMFAAYCDLLKALAESETAWSIPLAVALPRQQEKVLHPANGRRVHVRELEATGGGQPPTGANDSEEALLRIFEAVLQVDGLEATIDFFDLGASSLQLIHVCEQAADVFGCELSVTDLLGTQSIAALARRLEERRTTGWTPGPARKHHSADTSDTQRLLSALSDAELVELFERLERGESQAWRLDTTVGSL